MVFSYNENDLILIEHFKVKVYQLLLLNTDVEAIPSWSFKHGLKLKNK